MIPYRFSWILLWRSSLSQYTITFDHMEAKNTEAQGGNHKHHGLQHPRKPHQPTPQDWQTAWHDANRWLAGLHCMIGLDEGWLTGEGCQDPPSPTLPLFVTRHVVSRHSPVHMHCVHCMYLTRPIRPKPQSCISELKNLCLYWVIGQHNSEALFRKVFPRLVHMFTTVFGPRYWLLRVLILLSFSFPLFSFNFWHAHIRAQVHKHRHAHMHMSTSMDNHTHVHTGWILSTFWCKPRGLWWDCADAPSGWG